MTALLDAAGIFKAYTSLQVLKDVSLQIASGETLAIIGPNGAGKTTLFKVLSGELRCDKGTIRYDAQDVTSLPSWRRVHLGFGRTFQVARVFLELTALENVVISVEAMQRRDGGRNGSWFAWRPSRSARQRASEVLAEVGLEGKRDEIAQVLSYGDRKRLELAITLATHPKLLMMDEPTAGMAPADRAAVVKLIATLRKRHNMTVMLTEHDMGVVFGLADRIVVMNYGELVATGTPNEVRANPLVRDIYLGTQGGHGA